MKRLLLSLILLISFIPMSYQDSDDKIISGTKGNYEINLVFSEGEISGKIIFDDKQVSISENSKVIQKKNKTLIFDKENDLKILFRQLTDEKYLIIVKIEDSRIRFIAEEIKNFSQRNLWDELKEKEKITIDSELLEKQRAINEAEEKFQLKIERLEKNNQLSNRTSDSILADFEKSKELTGMSLVTEKVKKNFPLPLKEKEIRAFLSVPHMTAWKEVLRYDVLVTDDTAQRYDGTYKEYVGHVLKDVKIVGKLVNPDGEILQKFEGVTDSNGIYKNQYQIIDNSSTRGEYQVIVNATHTLKDSTIQSDVTQIFFVTYSYQDSKTRTLPTAPVLFTVTNATAQIDLIWSLPHNGNSPIIGYKIERESPIGNGFKTISITDNQDVEYSNITINPNTEYNYRIFAINKIGTSGASNELSNTLS